MGRLGDRWCVAVPPDRFLRAKESTDPRQAGYSGDRSGAVFTAPGQPGG